jgi:cytochrome c oxidase accessory protein FixG
MPLVAQREWIQPADLQGRFKRIRRVLGWGLIVFFVATPWISVAGLPAVQMDIPGRRFILLGAVFTPHDTWALALLLLLGALGLFLFTSLLGRVWCGWACPQTVWLDQIFRPLERWIEGPVHRRRRRENGPKNAGWWGRKTAKVTLFAAVTWIATGIFFSWFVGGPAMLRGQLGPGGWTMFGLLFGLFLLDALWFREQLCHYACPYARFQGVLMDRHSLIVAYDRHRGDPPGKPRDEAAGDCVDCNRCVDVCPSAIDIREGDQLQCIACAGCVDACNEVMIKIGKPQNLIRYTTERDAPAQPGEARPVATRRTFVYVAMIAGVAALLSGFLATRSEVAVQIARQNLGEIYRELPDGKVLNQYSIHVTNKDTQARSFNLRSDTEGVDVTIPGLPWGIAWGQHHRFQAFVSADRDDFSAGRLPFSVVVVRDDGSETRVDAVMLGPGSGPVALAAAEEIP